MSIPRTPLRLLAGDVHYRECTWWETGECNCVDIEEDYRHDAADRRNDSEREG